MPKLSGLEVLDATARRAGVIFTTAYDEYALQAFDRLAVDYLLKPFSQKRFDEALERARRLLHDATPAIESVNALVLRGGQPLERIVVRDRNQVHVVPVADIDFVEAQDDYVSIHTAQKTYLKTQALSELETQLDPRKFVRVHRSYLINLDKLASLERPTKDTQVAVLKNGKQVPVSRAGQDRIKAYLGRG